MLGRLERPLDVLIGGPRDLPTRQQTLRETLEWSYQLLQPSEQQTFRRLAVFAAGSSPHAAETIAGIAAPAGAVLADLIGLVDHSLLRRVEAHEDDARLMMLQTVKAFAAEELAASGEEPMIRAAHADFFLAMAEEAAPRFRFRVDDQAIDQIEREHDNLRAALRWCIDSGDSGRAVRLGAALARFWLVRGHLGDGRRWLDAVLALDAGQAPAGARAQALCGAGLLAHFQNQYDIAIERFEESLELARAVGDRQAVMQALSALAATVGRHRDPAAARGMYDEALAIAAELEDEEMTASLRLGLATIVWYQGDLTGASPMLHDSLAGAEAHDLAYESAGAHQILGYLALAEGELDGARAQLEAGMAALGKLHDRWGVARCKMGLGYAEDAARDFPAARAHFADCLAIIGELGHKLITCGCIGGLAIAAEAEGRPEVAATLLGAAAAIRERLGASHSQVVQEAQDRCLAAAREALGEPSFEHAFTVGSALTLDEARALAEREAREGSASEAAAGLTLAELRVLRLVAGGRTNADVAAVLVVSERTVHAHLRAIFRKLGVSNRGAATRYAVEHGIVE
jgi:DNA-binding CsgD family transcriptional regulator